MPIKKPFLYLCSLSLLLSSCTVSNATRKTEAPVHNSQYYQQYLMQNKGISMLFINVENGATIDSKETYVTATFDLISDAYDDVVQEKIQIKGRGNSTWAWEGVTDFPKRPYTIKLSEKANLLGMHKDKKWALVANYSDKTLLRNTYASYLGRKVFTNMAWAPNAKNVDVVLNHQYIGNYTLQQTIKIDNHRVDIQSVEDTVNGEGIDLNSDGTVDINDGGFIIEIDNRDNNATVEFTTPYTNCHMQIKDPDEEDFRTYVTNIINKADKAIAQNNGWKILIDIPSFVDWFLLNEFTSNTDSITWSYSAFLYYNPADKKIYMGPDWDFDISMGLYSQYGNDSPYLWNGHSGWMAKLLTYSDFQKAVLERWTELSSSTTALSASFTKLQELHEVISASSDWNFQKWPILGQKIWPDWETVSLSEGKSYWERTSVDDEMEYLTDWLTARKNWLDNNLENKLKN